MDLLAKRVLVLDADHGMRQTIGHALKSRGFFPELVGSLEEARDALKAQSERLYEAVIMDIVLGESSGELLIPFIKDLEHAPKVIVLTASLDAERNLLVGPYADATVYKHHLFEKDLLSAVERVVCTQEAAILELQTAYGLSLHETNVLLHSARGVSDKEIAFLLGWSTSTVRNTWMRIRCKLRVPSRDAALRAIARHKQHPLSHRRQCLPLEIVDD